MGKGFSAIRLGVGSLPNWGVLVGGKEGSRMSLGPRQNAGQEDQCRQLNGKRQQRGSLSVEQGKEQPEGEPVQRRWQTALE